MVDDNNNNRQGCLGFEEVFVPKGWEMRQFGFIVALCQANAFLLWNYQKVKEGKEELTKAEFVRDLAKELIENEDWRRERGEEEDKRERQGERKRRRAEYHEIMKIPTGCGKWDGRCFRKVKCKYQKYTCTAGCGRMIRTYCSCDKSLILCNECFAVHKAEYL